MELTINNIDDAGTLARATYWAAANCHTGQWSEGYEALSLMSGVYRPGCCESTPKEDDDDPEAFVIYDYLAMSGKSAILSAAHAVVDFFEKYED